MLETAYYVYALKDPRRTPAMPFYIGKGTGIRAWEHAIKADNTRKGQRIAEIQKQGKEVIVSKLADGLSDLQANQARSRTHCSFWDPSERGYSDEFCAAVRYFRQGTEECHRPAWSERKVPTRASNA